MIACEKCSQKKSPFYEGEWFKRVKGTAKRDMFCDYCCPPTLIKQGDKCAAESMGLDRTPYFKWEDSFIETVNPTI
jgi:hypothetical protein